MADLTDDASDLDFFREAINQIKSNDVNGDTYAHKIAHLFEVEVGSADFWYALSIINERLTDLDRLLRIEFLNFVISLPLLP